MNAWQTKVRNKGLLTLICYLQFVTRARVGKGKYNRLILLLYGYQFPHSKAAHWFTTSEISQPLQVNSLCDATPKFTGIPPANPAYMPIMSLYPPIVSPIAGIL